MYRLIAALLTLATPLTSLGAERGDSVLQGLDGIGLEVLPINMRSTRFSLTERMLKERVAGEMEQLQLDLLTKTELEGVIGMPYLEVGVSVAHAQGPSHFYTITVKLREMAALERPQETGVSMALSTWERESMGVANRPEAVLQTVGRMLRIFSEEYHRANVQK